MQIVSLVWGILALVGVLALPNPVLVNTLTPTRHDGERWKALTRDC
jgi:hypothetical protein